MSSNLIKTYIRLFLETLFGRKPKNFKRIPIIINNYNRLTCLKNLINSLEQRGYSNIQIIDNKSSYPPLLEFYKQTSYKVYQLNKNLGFKALWKSKLWYRFLFNYYVYTDADIDLVEECPDNFLEYFYSFLKKYPMAHKIGFSLKIDDLPDHYALKQKVIDWERQFYNKTQEENIFIAPIDTTFALYRPFSRRGRRDGSDLMFRTGYPYQSRHMPWYVDSDNLPEEERFYVESTTQSHWAVSQKNQNNL